ncbi:MAG TPA: helix-turn-helix transcriptional regulator [Candidatus Limiplasma sp.]|nr:helix-turn-helix transcriptional regulator [Candidatus Limiplasma sp.]
MDFGQRLRELRTERGENQSVLAEQLGVSGQSYSAYENGREPPYSILRAIAKYFGVTADYLLSLSDAREPENANIVKELGLTEASIQVIKTCIATNALAATRDDLPQTPNDQRLFSSILDEDSRTYLDILNLILVDPVFMSELMPLLAMLSSPTFNRFSIVKIPHTVFQMNAEPCLLLGLHEAIDSITNFVREESRGLTHRE